MKVLALFDGISVGYNALLKCEIPITKYIAYEIDETAIAISKQNFPSIIHKGDVTTANFDKYKGFDLILAGFPCQDLSINKANREGLKGSRSGLFWYLVEAIKKVQPKYFLVENNYGMPESDKNIISNELGVEPIFINSASFSAQNRRRLYWTNIPVDVTKIPVDSNQNVANIIIPNLCDEKNLYDEVTFNEKRDNTTYHNKPLRIGTIGKGGQGERVYSLYGKSVNLTANGGGRGAKTGLYLIDNNIVRKLTPIEAERLQTLPDNYTEGFSNTKRLKALGNGWTSDVIAFILSFIEKEDLS